MKIKKIARPNELLKREREQRQLSQADVAIKLDLPDWRIVSRWERGISFPSPHYRRLLCEYFEKSPQELGLVSSSDNFWNVPYPLNPLFTGRENILACMDDLLRHNQMKQPLALYGIGGVGKTQLVLEYAYRHRKDYYAIFWVNAASQETLDSAFIEIAEILNLPEASRGKPNAVISAVKQWLSPLSQWLLIFDDIEDLYVVRDYLPFSYQGQVLLTTRMKATGALARAFEIPPMEQEEGISLLLQRAKRPKQLSATDIITVKKIIEATEGLPLALDQAGAYIEQTGCSLVEYLDLYQMHANVLLCERGYPTAGHPESVITTFQLAFERVQRVNPQAMELLEFLASLDLDVVTEEAVIENISDFKPSFASVVTDRLLLNVAFTELLKYSLVRREAGVISVHPLVRTALKGNLQKK